MSVSDRIRRGSAVARRALLAPATLALAVALFGVVALLQRGLLPDEAALIATPAFAVALLTDAVLYNDVGLRGTRPPSWLLVGTSLYLQAAVFVAVARWVRGRY